MRNTFLDQKTHRRSWLKIAAALVLAAGVSATGTQADVKKPRELRLTYDFYIAGLPIAKAKLNARIEDGFYSAESSGKTTGIAALFFGSKVESSGGGLLMPTEADAVDGMAPQVFEAYFKVKKKDMTLRIAYDGDAPESVEAEPPFRKKSYEIDPTEQHGALDPMSAIVAAYLPVKSAAAVCNRTITVFDGRKRFDVRFDGLLEEYEEDGARYVECAGTYFRIGGFKKKHMTPERRTYPFKIRFRMNKEGAPLPVRIWGDTDFGTAVALLRD